MASPRDREDYGHDEREDLDDALSPIDRRCLAWMREAELHDYVFGSVSNRPCAMTREERACRRYLQEIQLGSPSGGGVEVLDEDEAADDGEGSWRRKLLHSRAKSQF